MSLRLQPLTSFLLALLPYREPGKTPRIIMDLIFTFRIDVFCSAVVAVDTLSLITHRLIGILGN